MHLQGEFAKIPAASILAFPPPAIRGLGVSGGFQMEVEDVGSVGLKELGQATEAMVAAGNGQTILQALNTTFSASVPQLYLNIDRDKVKSLALPLSLVFNTLQTYLGSTFVNNYNQFGLTYQVRVQAEADFRDRVEDITKLQVRNATGSMIPLGTLLKVEHQLGPSTILRYNRYPAATITGQTAPGISSGQGLEVMEQMARQKLPTGVAYDWTAMSFQEKQVGNQAITVFALAVLLVYLVLAAQYESWIRPAAVILVVPLALLGTVIAVALRGMDNNIYTQIGIVLIIALASKNAILIVEFAWELANLGPGHLGGGHRSGSQAIPPDSDDIAGIYSGRLSVGHRPGSRRGEPPGVRHRRVWRHDRLDVLDNLLRSGVFRPDPKLQRMVGWQAGDQPATRAGRRAALEPFHSLNSGATGFASDLRCRTIKARNPKSTGRASGTRSKTQALTMHEYVARTAVSLRSRVGCRLSRKRTVGFSRARRL